MFKLMTSIQRRRNRIEIARSFRIEPQRAAPLSERREQEQGQERGEEEAQEPDSRKQVHLEGQEAIAITERIEPQKRLFSPPPRAQEEPQAPKAPFEHRFPQPLSLLLAPPFRRQKVARSQAIGQSATEKVLQSHL
jgi:hypothetical protein